MKPDRLIFANLGHGGVCMHKFPPEFPMSHDLGLTMVTHLGRLLGSSLQHRSQICSSGNVKVKEAFICLRKVARAFCFWFSRAYGPKSFSHIKQVTSHMHNLVRLQFGSLKEEHAVQMFLARLAQATLGRLWNDIEQKHASNLLTIAGFATIVPPFENISPKMLAESMAFGNIDGYFNRPADQPCLDGKRLSCCAVAVPSTIFQEDAVEPKTGIKFPAFLEDEASPATAVLVGVGFKGMKIMRVKNLNLYAFGLYMQPQSICEKLGPKYASVPTTKLKDDPDFYNDLLRENLHIRVRLVVNYNGLSIGAVRDVFEKSLGLRLQKMNPNTDYRCLKTFGSYFTEDIPIPAGTKIDFCQTSDGQLITEIDGRQISAVQSKDLCRAFFDMYIGDSPVSLEAKKEVARNVAGLMGRCL
ncbi:fatty-acid-binding protein 2 [Lolium perenne]|uniref:fatty-acid-binding protein 2 n=1 Tax=Lolium perenne TaxID=4522 RepID=UPI0021F53F04|nr:fatty-acid-binding protein 2-like [Lolium perenne]